METRYIGAMSAGNTAALFNHRYLLESCIGRGGMGVVYQATDQVSGDTVALKVIREDLLQHEELLPRFRREARAASRIDSPHVTRVVDFGEDERGRPFLVMELVQGPLLSHQLRQGPLEFPRALRILHQVALGLDAAHRCQVIHRDLKPGNVVLTTHRGETDHVKILDFGLAKILGSTTTSVVTPLGHTFGTAEYISPEQARDQELDHRADIYSFGVLAFEVLTGRVPFAGDTIEVVAAHVYRAPPSPRALAPTITAEMEQLVLRCLAKRPEDRHASAAELVGLLQPARAHGCAPLRSPESLPDSGRRDG